MRAEILQDRFLRNLIWISDTAPETVVAWLEVRFPKQMTDDHVCIPVGEVLKNFVYPGFIERFCSWLMPHWPDILMGCRITSDCEFPTSNTALVSIWWSGLGATEWGQPKAINHVTVNNGYVFDPDCERILSIREFLEFYEKSSEQLDNLRVLNVVEKPALA